MDWNFKESRKGHCKGVEAYAASWIEILSRVGFNRNPRVEAYAASWIEITGEAVFYWPDKVEAYAASWIEIQYLIRIISNNNGRGLRSLVDWNRLSIKSTLSRLVEAYAASWIEMK